MTPSPTDLRRATRGDRDALHRVIEGCWPQMRRWAIVFCGDVQSAEDAVQEALVRVVRHIGRYDPARPFGPWLKAVVRHACHDELSRRGRAVPELPAAPEPARPGRRLDLARAAERVREAFVALSPRQRELVDLVDLQGLSPTEAAARLELTPGAVRAQLHAARHRLRTHLSRDADILPLLREA